MKENKITHLESYAHEHYKEPYHCHGKEGVVRCGMWIDASKHEQCPVCGEPIKTETGVHNAEEENTATV